MKLVPSRPKKNCLSSRSVNGASVSVARSATMRPARARSCGSPEPPRQGLSVRAASRPPPTRSVAASGWARWPPARARSATSPTVSMTAAGRISRRVAGSPLARKAGAHTSRAASRKPAASPGRAMTSSSSASEASTSAGCGQQRPPATARERRGQGDQTRADERARRAVLDGEHLDAAECRHGERERATHGARSPGEWHAWARGGAAGRDPRCACS